jgi:Protein of unknown function (DUF2516)/Protein of unknown function (DUF2510)
MVGIIVGPEILLFVLFSMVLGPLLCIFGLIDVVRRPDWVWQASGQNKTLWLVLTIVGIVLFFVTFSGVVIGLVYLLAIRPKLAWAAERGGPTGGYGTTPPAPPPGWYPDPAGSGQNRYWNGVAWSGPGPT